MSRHPRSSATSGSRPPTSPAGASSPSRRSASPKATGPDADGLYLRMDERAGTYHRAAGRDRPGARGRLGGARPVRAGQRRPRRRGGRLRRQGAAPGSAASAASRQRIRSRTPPARRSRCSSARCSTTARSSPVRTQRFVTGDQGMGHVVLPTTAMDRTACRFYTEVLGFLPRGAIRVGGRPRRVGPLAGSASWASTSATTAWRSARRRTGRRPASST